MDRRRFAPADEVAPRAWAGLAVVAAALFVATLDAMVLYVAFGTLCRDFPDVSAAALSWILSGYTVVLAAGMIGAGRWADRLGRRRVFLAGLGVFTVASAICAVAPGVGVLVAARVLQGFGAAALTPASLALILQAFPKSRVPQAIALWGAAGALAGRAGCARHLRFRVPAACAGPAASGGAGGYGPPPRRGPEAPGSVPRRWPG